MNQDWEDLHTILALVRHGSLVKAGAALGVNYTTVARRIVQAEERYGVKLFDRLPQGYAPREVAHKAARQAEQMEQAEAGFRLHLGGRDASLQGELTITAPQLLIVAHLHRVIADFTALHPQVLVRVLASNELVNLNLREADLAIRISDSPGDTLIGRRLAHQNSAAFAAPELAQKIAANPEMQIDWIGFGNWGAPPKDVTSVFPNSRLRLRMDDMSAVVAATQAGMGVARMPFFLGRHSGMVQLPLLSVGIYPDIWMVAHKELWSSAKVAAFRRQLVPYFKSCAGSFLEG